MAVTDYRYTEPEKTNMTVATGATAEATDVNKVWETTNTKLYEIYTDTLINEGNVSKARGWATADQDTEPDPTTYPGEYSSKAWAEEAKEWAESADGLIDLAEGGTSSSKSAYEYSVESGDSAGVASGHASDASDSEDAAGLSESAASDSAEEARQWAEHPEDNDVDSDPGSYSALHYSAKAATSASSMTDSVEEARQWAEHPEGNDVDSDPGSYSALHHAAKSEGFSEASESSATASSGFSDDSEEFATGTPTGGSSKDWATYYITGESDEYVPGSSPDALSARWWAENASETATAGHTIASHTDTDTTGAELNTLTNGSNADALHAHVTLQLGSTDSTAYRGDRGATAYSHSQAAHAPSDANNYTHPSTHPPSIIAETTSDRFISNAEAATWSDKYTQSQTDVLLDAKVSATGLEYISDDGGTTYGWRLIGKDIDSSGDIGDKAVDVSNWIFSSTSKGPTGGGAFSANGGTTASGDFSSSFGEETKAINRGSLSCGKHNEGSSLTTVFEVGTGTQATPANGLEVHDGGSVVMPSLPTSDPSVLGALWIDIADSRTLKVSAG